MKMNNLPPNWSWVTLGDICERITKGSTPTSYGFKYQNTGINFVKTENIDSEGNVFGIKEFINDEANDFLNRSKLNANDVLFSIAGTIGRVGVIKETNLPANTNQALAIIRLSNNNIFQQFVYYYLKSPSIQKGALKKIVGVGRANLSLTNIAEFKIPLPPLPIQKKIVAKIEELFSELDNGIAQLKKAKEQIKIYRQAVLKYAFEGRLIKDDIFRKDVIFARKAAEPNIKYRSNAERLNGIQEASQNLPAGWKWVKLGEVAEIKRGKSKHRPRNAKKLYDGKYPFIQTGEIRAANGGTIRTFHRTYNEIGLAQSKLWAKGTLCISIAANIGETAFLGFEACFPDSVVGIVPNKKVVDGNFINYFLRKEKEKISELAPATAQKNINVDILQKLNIPLPHLFIQHQIVQEIESRFSVADKLEQTIDESLSKAEALKQSILKQAFEGKLFE